MDFKVWVLILMGKRRGGGGSGDEFLWPSASAVNRKGVWMHVRITACVTPVLLQRCREFTFANECEPFISSATGWCLWSVIYSGENRGKLLIITAAVGEEEIIFTYFCYTEPHKKITIILGPSFVLLLKSNLVSYWS